VRDLLQRKQLELRLLGGASNLDNIVRLAHAMELVDSSVWLEGGEFLMTTGLDLGSPTVQRSFMEAAAKSCVAGIGFGVGFAHSEVPPTLVEEADRLQIPLLEIPLPIPFIAIIKEVVRSTNEARERELRWVIQSQRDLTKRALRDGVAGIAEGLSSALACECVVVTTSGDVLFDDPSQHRTLYQHVVDVAERAGRALLPFSVGNETPEGYVVVQGLGIQGRARAFLGIRKPGRLTPELRVVLEHANLLFALELEKPSDVIDAERRLQADVLRAIIAGSLSVADQSQQLASFGINPVNDLHVIVISSTATTTERLIAVHSAMAEQDGSYLTCAVRNQVVLLHGGEPLNLKELHGVIKLHSRRRVHLGRAHPADLAGFGDAVRQATMAARAAQAEDSAFRDFGDLSTYTLLLSSQSSDALALIADAALAPLMRAGGNFRGELLQSLDAYLANNAQWVPAANALGIHRHTLRNRMRRVEEITGRNLASAHDRTELWLALKAHELSELASA
jgi:purine catabolism regulator